MRRYRMMVIGLLAAAAVGCDQTPTAPPGAVVGTWGGQGVHVTAGASSVRMQFSCSWGVAEAPLLPDAAGRFVMSIELSGQDSANPVVVRGTVDGSQMDLEVITITTDAMHTSYHSALRDQAPTFGMCALI